MDYLFLSKTILFQGISPEELPELLHCLKGETRSYQRGNIVYHRGDMVNAVGIVLSGSVSIENDDVWGNKSILDR
ncbi:MAG: cyclic nucleotide-binding domain-containing protein, partial [Anaerotignum sp.]